MAEEDLPGSARVVVVGGGVGGTSVAYHLAQMGCSEVLLVERDELTNGSTFHSAGLVGQLRSSVSLTRMMMYSVELYRRLARDPDTDPGWVECGGIRLASTPERLEELRRQVGWATTFGLSLEEISPAEAQAMFPYMETEGVLGATYLPTDGYLDPSQLAHALARGAREAGVLVRTHTRVTGIDVEAGRVRAVRTDRGVVRTPTVVNAGGMYAAEIGRMAGVRVPIVPFSHQYLVTQGFRDEEDRRRLPTLRDPDLLVYFREDARGLLMGGYERHSRPFALDQHLLDRVPADFNGRLLEEDWERFEEITENSTRRVPLMAKLPIRKLVNGPEGFTPDNEFCLGETEVRGFFVAAGFCAHGIAGAGGIGKVMAEWVLEGEPSLDVWEMDVRRFGRQYRSPGYTLSRVRETYETYYDIRYPNHERQAGRPLRVSPAYEWHRAHQASFGEKSGWERVNYYETNASAEHEGLRPRGWAGRHWSPAIVTEHLATRRVAGLFDESSFSKIEVSGPGAAALLERLCDNRVARGAGQVTYTQMLNRRGGVESDLTVTQRGDGDFLLVSGTAFGSHDLDWIRRHAPDDGSVLVRDATGAYACYALWGPCAREILGPLTPAELSNAAFPYMTAQETTVGDVPVLALRVTFVGELGWELYCSPEYGMRLWQTLWAAAEPLGAVAGGYRAIDSLRLEKGYRVWGSDVTPDENPFEAGLGFCVRLGKEGGFIGEEALRRVREQGVERRLCCVTLADARAVALGNEPVRAGGEVVGRVTSGGIGYSVGRSIAYAYLPVRLSEPGTAVEVYLFGDWVAGEVARAPLFDPEGERVRADAPPES
jgi:glycine cleavage system aminomethyltransferase T/glycine/D-amino acid oxidase-like deaminating enzyme